MIEEKDAAVTHQNHQRALNDLLREFDRVCKELNIPYVLFAGTLLGAVRHKGFIPWDDDLDIMMLREDYEQFMEQAGALIDSETFYLQKEFSEHWPMFFSKLRLNHTTCLEKYHPKDPMIHQGVYIDIFPCDNAAKTVLGRKIQFAASKVVISKCLRKRGYDTDSKKKKAVLELCRLLPMAPFMKIVRGGRSKGSMVHSFFGGASGYSKNVFERRYFTDKIFVPFEDGTYPIPKEYDELLTILYGDYMRIPPPEERVIKQHAILVDLENSYENYEHYRDGMVFEVHTRSIR